MNSSTSNSKQWLLLWLTAWLLPLFIFFGSTEWLLRSKIIPQDNAYLHIDFFKKAKAQNAIFGDSHASLGFNGGPQFINLAYPSESLMIIEYKIKTYFQDKNPNQIILQGDPHLLSAYRESLESEKAIEEYFIEPFLYFSSFRHRIYLVEYWKTYFKQKKFKPFFAFLPDGSQSTTSSMEKSHASAETQRKVMQRIELQKPAPGFENTESAKSYLRILAFLKSKNAQVCIITFPVAPIYAEESKKYPTFEKARVWYEEQARKHAFQYVNYWNWYQDYGYFSNQDHLNAKSAALFASQAIKDCFDNRPQLVRD